MGDSPIWGDLQAALYAAVDAGTTVATFWGLDPDAEGEEAIFVGAEEDTERDWKLIRGGGSQIPVDEAFRNQVVIQVRRESGTDLKPAYERASAIAKEVETAIRNDPTLGGLAFHVRIARVRRRFMREDKTRKAMVFMDIAGEDRF
jgi:hypothetical protein